MLREESTDSPMIRNSKIAMHLPKKTMRDVALRCKWMAINDIGKKRRGGSLSKRKDKKGRAVNSSARACCCPAARFGCPIYDALMRKYLNSLDYISCYETGGQTGELFRHNSQIFDRISQNIINLQINDNVDLFNQARENILSAMNECVFYLLISY
ncbi:hypothetical protein AXF42_Ash009488 [Apostasia shenzhenica]|uniref:Uncharacterized protein n=1 Tax=Apostasia shenzhenica TaxID=1088818 RepID=A0A2I0B8Y6_9ASPA|nr:hypothetical protein AXF42_Ash009488 [Apostasia shenzhenica]